MREGKKLEVAVIKGDDVGPEMIEAAVHVLDVICLKFGHKLKLYSVAACGESIEGCFEPLPTESLKIC